jgi:condensin complex subunit 2
MWRGMALEKLSVSSSHASSTPSYRRGLLTVFIQESPELSRLPTPPEPQAEPPTPGADDKKLKFTSVMNDLQRVYPKPAMDDISTSFCFISLLHLANEKGLVIEKTPDLTELDIRRDWTASNEGEA